MALRVVSGGYDITDKIEGLGWSSIDPGGDETCTFTLKRSWFASSPEIARGNLLRVTEGVDVLWQGRVEEADRSGESTEQIGVTAYGLGARLKDKTMREIYIDGDLGGWGEPSSQRRAGLIKANIYSGPQVTTGFQDAGAAGPAILMDFTNVTTVAGKRMRGESWYSGGGIALGKLLFRFVVLAGPEGSAAWVETAQANSDDTGTEFEVSGGLVATTTPTYQTFVLPSYAEYVNFLSEWSDTGGGAAMGDLHAWEYPKVLGTHGLALQGDWPHLGFLVSQMVVDAVERAQGISLRRLDPTTFVSEQAVFRDSTKIEDVVSTLNKFEAHHRTWGTWGPDSPLDNSTDGYFDYRTIDADPTWIAYRSECESCNLHSETATLFDTVHVNYTSSGIQRTVTRTADVPELNGIPREETIDGGTLTQAGAETLGDAVLDLSGGFAPARGSIVLAQPIRHVDRGLLPGHYARADGSAIRVPDILPSSSLFALDSSPDRRTTFPIKRVAVDAGNKAAPVTTIEVDQTSEAISALQARLAQNAEVRGG